MKQALFSLLIVSIALVSCGTMAFEDEQESDNDSTIELKTVTFSINGTDGDFNTSRASTAAKDRFSYLQYWIYDEGYTEIVASGEQKTSSDDDFGTFSEDLTYGTYHVVVVGHNQSTAMSIDGNGMVVKGSGETHLGDTYYGNAECKVEGNSSTTITMQRNTCNMYVTSNGSAAKVGYVDVVVNAYGMDFGVKDGVSSSDDATTSYKINFTNELRKGTIVHFSIYLPLPAYETIYDKVSVSLTAYDTNGDKMGSTDITDIPAKIGRRVKYTRGLWGGQQKVNVIVSDDDWEEVDGDA